MNRRCSVFFPTLLAVALIGAPIVAQDPSLPMNSHSSPPSAEPGLLFYLSGDLGFNADYAAGGIATPNYLSDIKILPRCVSGIDL